MAEQEKETTARKLFAALEDAAKIVATFKSRHEGREPTDAELRVAATLFIEEQRANGRSTNGNGKDHTPESDSQKCPICEGEMWDNRPKKKSGEFKKSAPDFKCKDKDCDGAVWPPRGGRK